MPKVPPEQHPRLPPHASIFLVKVGTLGLARPAMSACFHHGLSITVILAVLINVWSRADGRQGPDANGPKLGEAAPDFTLSDDQGKPLHLKDYQGHR